MELLTTLGNEKQLTSAFEVKIACNSAEKWGSYFIDVPKSGHLPAMVESVGEISR